MAASILSGSVPKAPSASPPTAEISTSPAICRTSSAVPSAIWLLCETSTIPTIRRTFQRPRRGIEEQVRGGRPWVLMPLGPGPEVARPPPPRRHRDRGLCPLLRGLRRRPEHRRHAPFAGGLLRGLDRGLQGVHDRLVPHLRLAALLYAAEGGFEGFGRVLGGDLLVVSERRRGAQEGRAVERARRPAHLADEGHGDGFQHVGRGRGVGTFQTFERGLEAPVHVVAVVSVPYLRIQLRQCRLFSSMAAAISLTTSSGGLRGVQFLLLRLA